MLCVGVVMSKFAISDPTNPMNPLRPVHVLMCVFAYIGEQGSTVMYVHIPNSC